MSTVLWTILALLMLAGFALAARRVQTAPTAPGRVMVGIGGAFLGLGGLVILASVLLG